MTCGEIRERILEASAAALAGHGESAVARHVRGCAACRAIASSVLGETERLASDLEHVRPRMGEGDAVRLARQGRAAVEDPAVRDRGRRWLRWGPVPVAAAAAITALLLTEGPRRPGMEETGPAAATRGSEVAVVGEPPAQLSVDVPEQGRIAVFETSDPSVTVVWFY